MPELADHVQRFNNDGFLVLPDVLSPQEVQRLRDGLERAFAEPLKSEEGELRGSAMSRL